MSFDLSKCSGTGTFVWRIEKLDVNMITDPAQFGAFYSGDCYIVLHAYQRGYEIVRDIHFWLGNESSVDERGAAALHTVRLDDSFGGEPTQHREVQGHESALFLSYFKSGIRYLEGGIESAFKTVDREAFTTRLFHLKGKREVRASQVALTAKSLNEGDVFVLDAGRKIYIWNGSSANRFEKIRAAEFARRIRDEERGGQAELIFIKSAKSTAAGTEFNATPADEAAFWTALQGSPADVLDAIDDDVAMSAFNPKLYKVNLPAGWDAKKGGEGITTELIAESKLDKSSLASSGVYIVDAGANVYVWTGKTSEATARAGVLVIAATFLGAERDLQTSVTRVVEGGEPVSFTSLFNSWPRLQQQHFSSGLGARLDAEAKAITEANAPKIDNFAVLSRRAAKASGLPSDGTMEIWRIENFRRVPYPKEKYGHFYAGDSYIVKFTYLLQGTPMHILYFWQGEDSSADERGASAFLTVGISDEIGGAPQVRVVQGKEPVHFISIFKGSFIVHKGGVASGFAAAHADAATESSVADGEAPTTPVSLYQIKSIVANATRTVEVKPVASSLNSGDIFFVVPNTPETHAETGGAILVWQGSGANKDEREAAQKLANSLTSISFRGVTSAKFMDEGAETEQFWSLLGGVAEYARVQVADETYADFEPRLFHCSDARGRGLIVEEIFNWSQDDLINDDVMILDAGTEIFVWIGSESTQEEKDGSKKLAMDFIERSPEARLGKDTPIYTINAGQEPPNFTSHFIGWDQSKQNRDSARVYEDLILRASQARATAEAEAESKAQTNLLEQTRNSLTRVSISTPAPSTASVSNASVQTVSAAAAAGPQPPRGTRDEVVAAGFLDPVTNKFPLEQLRTSVPEGVDPTCKDMYLSPADLESLVGMASVQFKLLRRWRQLEILEDRKF